MPNYRIDVEIEASRARAGRQAVAGELTSLERQAARLGTALKSALAFAGITAGLAGLKQMVQEARQFADAMAEVSTLVDTAKVNMDQLTAAAREQARAFGGDAAGQARALYQIISAGASDAAKATEILTAANKLAVGGVTDVTTAADGLTSVLNAYGDAVGSATDVSDTLFVGMRAGKTTVEELSRSVGKVAPLAAQLGVSFDELIASAAALTKGGIRTQTAMEGLRAVFAAVAKPSSEAAKLSQQLGLEFSAAGLQAKGLAGFMQELIDKTGGSQEQLALLFGGVEALVPVLALAGQAGVDFTAILADMENKANQTENAVTKMSESPGFKLNQLTANAQGAIIDLGNAILVQLLPAITALNENFSQVTAIISGLVAAFVTYKTAVITVTAVQTAYVALTAAAGANMSIFAGAIATVYTQLGLMAAASTAATAGVAGLSAGINTLTAALARNPIGIFAVALAGLVGWLVYSRNSIDDLNTSQSGLTRTQKIMSRITQDVAKETSKLATATGEAREESLKNIQVLKAEADRYLAVASAAATAAAAKAAEAYQNYRETVNNVPGGTQAYKEGTYFAQQAKSRSDEAAAAAAAAGAEYREAMQSVSDLRDQIEAATKPVETLTGATNGLTDATDAAASSAENHAAQLAKEYEAVEKTIAGLRELAAAYLKNDEAALRAEVALQAANQAFLDGGDAAKLAAQELRRVVAERTVDAAQNIADLRAQTDALSILNNQVEEGSLTVEEANQQLEIETQLRPLITAAAVAEGEQKQTLIEIIEKLRDAYADNNDELERQRSLAQADAIDRRTAEIKAETVVTFELGRARISALRGLSGAPLENELARINAEHDKAAVAIRAESEAARLLADGLDEAAEAVLRQADAELQLIDLEEKFDAEARAAQRFADQVSALASSLSGLNGFGGIFGNLIGVLSSGNPGAALVGSGGGGFGKLGIAAGLALNPGILSGLTSSLTAGINSIGLFGAGTTIGAQLASGLVGAGIGGLFGGPVGSIFGRGGSKGGSIGGTIGGFALGPVGALAGALLGGGLGALVTSTPKGRATFSGGLDYTLTGNSASRRETAGGIADTALATLQQIADSLGATLGGFTGTISQRGNNLRYDPTGQGITKTSKGALDFGQDQEALLAAIVEDAVRDGAFQGLSQGFQDYLESGAGTIEQRVQDLIDVTSIQKIVEAFKDPLSAALKEFDAQAEQYTALYEKVGASAESTADLENYLADARQKLIDQYSETSEVERQARELEIQIMELEGRTREAVLAKRQDETASVDASLLPLYERIYALQDEAQATAEANAIQQEASQLQIRLAQALGDAEEVLRLQREQELGAVSDVNRALLESVYAAEDAARAQQQLAQAQQQAAQSAQTAAGALTSGGASLFNDPLIGGFASSLLSGGSVETVAAQIHAALQGQANAAFPNDPAGATGFYNDLLSGIATQNALNQASARPSFGIGGIDTANYSPGNQGDPGNGLGGSLGSGQQRSGSVRDAYVSLGGLQLWAQALMGGAGVGDLPGWGGFSSPAARERALARFGDLGSDGAGGTRGPSEEQIAELSDAYNREVGEINNVIDSLSKLRDSLSNLRDDLETEGQLPADTYDILRRRLVETYNLARGGDQEAASNFIGQSQDFLSAAARQSTSTLGYQQEVDFIRSMAAELMDAAQLNIDYEKEKLEKLNEQVEGLIDIRDSVDGVKKTVEELLREIKIGNDDRRAGQNAIARNTGKVADIQDRVTQGGTASAVTLDV